MIEFSLDALQLSSVYVCIFTQCIHANKHYRRLRKTLKYTTFEYHAHKDREDFTRV